MFHSVELHPPTSAKIKAEVRKRNRSEGISRLICQKVYLQKIIAKKDMFYFLIDFLMPVARKKIIIDIFLIFADAFLFFFKTCTAKMVIYQGYTFLLGGFEITSKDTGTLHLVSKCIPGYILKTTVNLLQNNQKQNETIFDQSAILWFLNQWWTVRGRINRISINKAKNHFIEVCSGEDSIGRIMSLLASMKFKETVIRECVIIIINQYRAGKDL